MAYFLLWMTLCSTILSFYSLTAQENPCSPEVHDVFDSSTIHQRSTGNIAPRDSKSLICDISINHQVWHRFISPAGSEMPTTCPPSFACGTRYPVWLNDTHPTSYNQATNVKACINVEGVCCLEEIQIQAARCRDNVKNEDFFVYKLAQLTWACPVGYCIGKEVRCPTGQTSATGFTPCHDEFPKQRSLPKVRVDVHNSRIRFTCDFEIETIRANNRYNVTWYSTTGTAAPKILKVDPLENNQTKSYLKNENTLRTAGNERAFCLNQNIFCEVRSFFAGSEDKSDLKRSNVFYAGIKVSPTNIIISEKGPTQNVTLTSTVPIVCNHGSTTCGVNIRIEKNETQAMTTLCSLRFKPGDKTKTMNVAATKDFIDDNDRSLKIKFNIPRHANPLDWFCTSPIPEITVTAKDAPTRQCRSTGDPYINTFDGTWFPHYKVGDYVLVTSKARLFEVHARAFECQRSVSCNCGVAAREGDDVMVVDMCQNTKPPIVKFASTVLPQEGSIIERGPDGKTFILNFPSGARVTFVYRNPSSDIIVSLPPDDYQNTRGLCGTWNGNTNDDFTSASGHVVDLQGSSVWLSRNRERMDNFTESYRFKDFSRESLFYYQGAKVKSCTATRIPSYCSCKGDGDFLTDDSEFQCDNSGLVNRPKYQVNGQKYAELVFTGHEHCGKRRRRRRSAEENDRNVIIMPDEDPSSSIYDFNPPQITTPPPTFPTSSGITQQQAEQSCERALRDSTSGRACLRILPTLDITPFMQQCIEDTKVLDDSRTSIISAVAAMMEECEEETLRNVALWTADDDGNLQPPQAVGDALCPSDCSGNGRCVNSTCVCDAGFLSVDCSINEGDPPVLEKVASDGLCDIRKQDCLRARVIGRNYVESDKLACRTKKLKVESNLLIKESTTSSFVTSRSDMLTFRDLSCEIPGQHLPLVDLDFSSTQSGRPVGGVSIQLSNDGETFSNESSNYIAYDSKCVECNSSTDCRWKVDSCRVNNYCLAVDEPHFMDWCQICRGNNTFNERTDNSAPVFRPTLTQRAFPGQTLRFTVPVTDPEQKRLKFNLVGTTPDNMEISSAGVITWTAARENKTYNVRIRATDICGNFSEATYMFESVSCPCERLNGAKCGAYPNVTCQCPKGCIGENCTQDIQGEKCIIEGQKETKEQKKSYFNLECQSNGLKAAFNLSHLERHGLPYIVRFKGEDHDCQPLNGTYGNLYGDDKLWIAANYSDCGIKAYEEGGKIAFEQTIVVEYGTKMDSSLIQRQFVDTYNATCLIERNITRQFNISVTKRKAINSEEDDESDFVFDFDILKAGTNAWTGLIYVGEKMDFDLSLNGASNSIKTSPQDCYATRLDGTGKYVLIKDRCSVGGETGVTITTTPQDTREFSWEMEAFRYFGDSDGIIITCRILICRNRPFDQLSEECRRCGQKAPLALRRKRNVDNEDDDVLTDKSVKSQPIFIAVRNTPDEMDGGSSGAKSSSDGLGTAETAAIIVIAGLVGLVLCIAIIKKIFFNNPTIKEVHIDSPRE
ncbi:von Willebrand factor D and EGF domain-containing protein-like [Clytia hemisphaerica]|uniref:Uncharacterized protein n=1 Tax=Clytia hemisphaerica TaxID=252671 RepID=A0A7M5X0M8_9CNID